MSTLKIGGATVNQTPLDWEGNLKNIVDAIDKAKKQAVDVLCFPELCIPGYGCEDLFNDQWVVEKAVSQLLKIVEHCEDICVSVGLPIIVENKTYNCACLIYNSNIVGISAKQHLANGGVYYEPRWFKPWPANKKVQITIGNKSVDFGDLLYEIKGIKIGFEICEDAWVGPERPGERLHQNLVDLVLNPSGSHFSFEKSIERQHLVINSSKSFNCTYLYVNLLGNEAGEIIYDGEILIASKGIFLNKNSTFQFADYSIVSSSVDFKSTVKQNPIAIEYLPKNEQFVRATSLGLFDYLRKSRNQGFVLSLSGGADSSCCAILVSEMVKRSIAELGIEKFLKKSGINVEGTVADISIPQIISKLLTCAYQSTINSSKETFESAKAIAHECGAQFHYWQIDNSLDSNITLIEKILGRKLNWEQDDLALQNIQARTRSPLIWLLANLKNSLLLVTSNRSESDVGYATMDGDTSGSLAPLAGVSKTFVRDWLKWAETELKYESLKLANALIPTAELRPEGSQQTDEGDLMPYEIMENIERLALWEKKPPLEIYEIISAHDETDKSKYVDYVCKFFDLMAKNQWKRERAAPSFQLDDFNINPRSWFRFPILSSGFKEELDELRAKLNQ